MNTTNVDAEHENRMKIAGNLIREHHLYFMFVIQFWGIKHTHKQNILR